MSRNGLRMPYDPVEYQRNGTIYIGKCDIKKMLTKLSLDSVVIINDNLLQGIKYSCPFFVMCLRDDKGKYEECSIKQK